MTILFDNDELEIELKNGEVVFKIIGEYDNLYASISLFEATQISEIFAKKVSINENPDYQRALALIKTAILLYKQTHTLMVDNMQYIHRLEREVEAGKSLDFHDLSTAYEKLAQRYNELQTNFDTLKKG